MPYMLEVRDDAKLGLAAEMLRRHGSVRLKAWGTSMLPSLWPGDLLTIQSVAHDEVVPGDIVLVLRDNRFSIHRLVETRRSSDRILLITRGDAVPQNDLPVPASSLLGRVASVRRGKHCLVPSRRVSMFASALAWMLCRWNHFRSLALRMHAAHMQAGATHP